MGVTKQEFTGNTQGLVDALNKLQRKFDKLESGQKKVAKGGKAARKELKETYGAKGQKQLGAFATKFIGIAAAGAAAFKIFTSWRNALDGIATSSKTSAENLASFFTVIDKAPSQQKLAFQFLQLGAAQGLDPGETAQVIEPIISALNLGDTTIIDKEEQRKIVTSFLAAAKAIELDIPEEFAGLVEVFGATRGLQGGAATGLLLAASGQSALSKANFGQVVSASSEFSTLQRAFAVAAALGESQAPGDIKTLVKAVGRELTPAGDKTAFNVAQGLAGLSVEEKVDVLTERGAAFDLSVSRLESIQKFAQQLENLEQRSKIGISAVLQANDKFFTVLDNLNALDAVGLTEELIRANRGVPGFQAARLERIGLSQTRLTQFVGRGAEAARQRRLESVGAGQVVQAQAARGDPFAPAIIDQITGRLGPVSRVMFDLIQFFKGSKFTGREVAEIGNQVLAEQIGKEIGLIFDPLIEANRAIALSNEDIAANTKAPRNRNVNEE